MEFQQFDVGLYFSKNYGMGDKPGVGKLNWKYIWIGVLLAVIGILSLVIAVKFNGALVGVILMLILFVVALGFMLPTILSKRKGQGNADAWQAEIEHRRSTWDQEFDSFYARTVAQMNLRQTAMNKIGIGVEQIADIEPFFIYGALLNGAQDWYRKDANGVIRADHNEITWLFFSKDQVYLYNIKFRLTNGKRVETTQEFFYTDIVSVTIASETVSVDKRNCIDYDVTEAIDVERFKLIVPGDKMDFAFTTTDGVTRSIQLMKNKIREKKVG